MMMGVYAVSTGQSLSVPYRAPSVSKLNCGLLLPLIIKKEKKKMMMMVVMMMMMITTKDIEIPDNTATVARQAASMLELVLDTQMLQPAASLASLVRQQPSMAVLSLAVPPLLPRLLPGRQTTTEAEAPTTAAQVLRQVLLAPFGTVNASYSLLTSPVDSSASSGSSSGLFSVGSSLLDQRGAEGTVAAAAAAVALAVQEQLPVVATTITIATTTANGRSEVLVAVYHPVYVTGVTAGETWGNALSNDVLNRICGSGACYDSRSETKLWGFVVALGSLNALANSPDTGLQGLSDKNYQYRLTVLPSGSGGSQGVDIAASAPPPRARQGTAAVPVRLAGPRSGSAAAVAETGAELLVDHDDAWQTAWEGPLIAATVVASLVLSAFFFSMLFNYWRHMAMLQAMLPEKVIRVLGTGSNYYQHFDCVTVLYADVVRYTTAKPQQGDSVPTLEVVKLLNDVHAMYESIIEKYGLVRIRRSGESFLCVGGCPTPDEPVTVATRVAACARDLVLATSRFRGVGGFRVQIRVGLHSGPAAAAVVGSKMPRFSLFGDVVDVAYFMEATSRAMAIHVSDRTSELLTKARWTEEKTERACFFEVARPHVAAPRSAFPWSRRRHTRLCAAGELMLPFTLVIIASYILYGG
ncbi:hypothetical protein VOLCADRAFT_91697 [Volvox carteri f. nagariensis]|uniref:Guanylate cyclase domain-containing protein n=1 Tax=Volvox carteri f. nagariensis TaxID=3068 RepID=D8TXR8_VOLCA|nr:uncharacterized protein VOLCADRAFT_91697 [Volvox carteri f. nagariensis]EFJ47689.1 hypothetical protein VOLCADRAFT_91697 [Volvox carteri f. nagariensis]|eukprot:XP_002951160.1 hypothetical protein VOLCADRAFT_91697 [Volvox carteri f. nagariensis]